MVVPWSDVDKRTNARKDFALPLIQTFDYEAHYGASVQGDAFAARRGRLVSAGFVRCWRPMLHEGRIEDSWYSLRGIYFLTT